MSRTIAQTKLETDTEANEYYNKINQEILKQKIEYAQKQLRNAKIKYNNLIEACVLVGDYTVECYEMEINVWTRQLEKLKNK